MQRTLAIAAAVFTLAVIPAFAAPTGPYKLDAKGKCHSSDGKFAKQTLCAAPGHTYKLDSKGKCHDETGKFAKQSLCHA